MENVDDLAQGLGLNADSTNYIHKGVLYTAKTIYDELENECPCLPVLLKGQQLQYPFYHPNINVYIIYFIFIYRLIVLVMI